MARSKNLADMDLRDLKLDEIIDELRHVGSERAAALLKDGRAQARRALGAPGGPDIATALAVGMVAGALIGATVALVLAPMSGRETRRRVTQQVERVRERIPEWEGPSGDGRPARDEEMARTGPTPMPGAVGEGSSP